MGSLAFKKVLIRQIFSLMLLIWKMSVPYRIAKQLPRDQIYNDFLDLFSYIGSKGSNHPNLDNKKLYKYITWLEHVKQLHINIQYSRFPLECPKLKDSIQRNKMYTYFDIHINGIIATQEGGWIASLKIFMLFWKIPQNNEWWRFWNLIKSRTINIERK